MSKNEGFWSFFQGNVRVLVTSRAIWSLTMSIPGPFLTLYMIALGATPVEIGLVSALTVVGGMIVEPLGGYLADRKGRVRLVSFFSFGYALVYPIFALAPDWRWLGLAQVLQQIMFFYSPGLNALLADSLPPGTRGRGYALERTFPAALAVAAPYLGGVLIAFYGTGDAALISAMRVAYWIAFFGGLLGAWIRRYLKETIINDAPSLLKIGVVRVIKESYGGIIETVRWLPSNFKPIVYLQVIQSTFIAMAAPFWVLYAKQVLKISAFDWGLMMLIAGVGGILLIIPIGALVDRIGAKKVIILSMILSPISVGIFILARDFWTCSLALVILTISNTMVTPSFAAIIADIIPRERRGRVYALIGENGIQVSTSRLQGGGVLLIAPAALGSVLGGYFYEWIPLAPFIIMFASLIAALGFTYFKVHEPEHAAH